MNASHPTIVLGGGFVGLFTALQLSHQPYPHPIILIEPRDRFVFKPLLYELLTGELHTEQICPSYAELLAHRSIEHIQECVQAIDLEQRQVTLASGESYTYGKLVLAVGSRPTFFNTTGAAAHAFTFSSAQEAIALRQHLHDRLRQALSTQDAQERLRLLTVAIVGAGPAGVELACTLADILPIWYDQLGGDYSDLRIVLINRSGEILNGDINSRLRSSAQRALTERTISVELLLNAAVNEIRADGIAYQQQAQDFLAASTVIWTAGMEPNSLLKNLPVSPEHRTRRGQLHVMPTLQLPDFPDVFVGGDVAHIPEAPQPATAQVAYQQGKAIAHNLQALALGRSPSAASVNLRGTLMKLGLEEGVANLFNRVELKGELGHLIRQATYLELLPTPVHNVKNTAEWFTDSLFQRHRPHSINPRQIGRTPLLAGLTATAASALIALPLVWRAAQPQTFQTTFAWTGVPTLLDQWAPTDTQ